MATHKVEMGPLTSSGLTPCFVDGVEILRTRHGAIYDGARHLLEHGLAAPEDRIEIWRGSMMCMSGQVGRCAEWTVSDTERGLKLRRWTLMPDLIRRDTRTAVYVLAA